MENSKILRLNGRDFTRGLVVAIIVAVLTLLQQFLLESGLDGALEWKGIVTAGLVAGIGYTLKNFLSQPSRPIGKAGAIL